MHKSLLMTKHKHDVTYNQIAEM